MELIFGGAYQGKLTWAVRQFALSQSDLFDLAQGVPDMPIICVYHLEALTLREANAGGSADALLSRLLPQIQTAVVIAREIGSGVVPLSAAERRWRELHGQVLRHLAERSEHVTRIFCGLEEFLK